MKKNMPVLFALLAVFGALIGGASLAVAAPLPSRAVLSAPVQRPLRPAKDIGNSVEISDTVSSIDRNAGGGDTSGSTDPTSGSGMGRDSKGSGYNFTSSSGISGYLSKSNDFKGGTIIVDPKGRRNDPRLDVRRRETNRGAGRGKDDKGKGR